MPTTENDRRNRQQPILENPSLPDHDRRLDPGMHAAVPAEVEEVDPDKELTEDLEIASPDQEFQQILESGTTANQGRIPEDPNNWLTSDPARVVEEDDPENRGDSLPDILEGDKH